ncbi:MAG: succinate dehydrogenase/fumarate reductase iron-sulfur subunit [Actinomycetaceae bacterium]
MKLNLRIWRQDDPAAAGRLEPHTVDDATPEMSVLELLDRLNEELAETGGEPVAFESDCREGICGACGVTVDGKPHGPADNTPSCHQRLSDFEDGQTVTIEPLRSAAFPVVRDLIVDRSAMDDLIASGGSVAVRAGTAPDADDVAVTHEQAEAALDMAACIGCGACVAACPNGSAHLFAGSKLAHLSLLPTPGQERGRRARSMVSSLEENFGPCSHYGECTMVCPAGIPLTAVAMVPKERWRAWWRGTAD